MDRPSDAGSSGSQASGKSREDIVRELLAARASTSQELAQPASSSNDALNRYARVQELLKARRAAKAPEGASHTTSSSLHSPDSSIVLQQPPSEAGEAAGAAPAQAQGLQQRWSTSGSDRLARTLDHLTKMHAEATLSATQAMLPRLADLPEHSSVVSAAATLAPAPASVSRSSAVDVDVDALFDGMAAALELEEEEEALPPEALGLKFQASPGHQVKPSAESVAAAAAGQLPPAQAAPPQQLQGDVGMSEQQRAQVLQSKMMALPGGLSSGPGGGPVEISTLWQDDSDAEEPSTAAAPSAAQPSRTAPQPARPRPTTATAAVLAAAAAGPGGSRRAPSARARRPPADYFPEDCTFKPQLDPKSRAIVRRGASARGPGGAARLQQLAQPKQLAPEVIASRRAEQEAALQECTFAPMINAQRSPHGGVVQQQGRPVPVHERLHQSHGNWHQRKVALLEERQRREAEACTFRPATNTARVGAAMVPAEKRAPLHQRLTEELRARSERRSHAAVKVESESDATFRPAINRRSVQLAMAGKLDKAGSNNSSSSLASAGERLYKRAEEVAAARAAKGLQLEAELAADCTFAPAINASSMQMLGQSNLPEDFLARQRYLEQLAAERKAAARAVVEQEAGPFQPRTLSRSLTADQLSDDTSDRFERLSAWDAHIKAKIEAKAEALQAQWSFKPRIDPRSAALGRRHSLSELYRNDQGQRARERVAKAVEDAFAAECTFAPEVARAPRYAHVEPRALKETGEAAAEERERRRLELQAMREYMELVDCTFAPKVHKEVPDFQQPVAIPGLGRYLEVQEMARRKREEEAAVAAAVFHENPSTPTQLFTVPQPFELRVEKRSEARKSRRQSLDGGKQDYAGGAEAAAQRVLQQRA